MKILLPIILITLLAYLLTSVVNNPKYDTVQDDCDMQGIINKTNLTEHNLISCNYN